MGWCSATDIFDSVAKEVIRSSASKDQKINILSELIYQLNEQDWDCQCESVLLDNKLVKQAMLSQGHSNLYVDEES